MIIYILFLTFTSNIICMEQPAVQQLPETQSRLSIYVHQILEPYMIESETSAQIFIEGLGTYALTQEMAQNLTGLCQKAQSNKTAHENSIYSFSGIDFKVVGQSAEQNQTLPSAVKLDALSSQLIIVKNVISHMGKQSFIVHATRSLEEKSSEQFDSHLSTLYLGQMYLFGSAGTKPFATPLVESFLRNPTDDKADTHSNNGNHFVCIDN